MPWDDVYAMATPGRAFDMFTNQAHVLRGDGERRPGGSLMLFTGGPAAAALMRESDEAITQRFLADLHDLYPQTRGVDRRRHRAPLGARQRLRAAGPRTACRRRWKARSAPTATSTSPATTSPSWGTWRPPPAPARVAAERVDARPRPPSDRGPPCLTSTGSSPPSSRRSPRTAPTSTPTRSPRSSTASSAPASAASCPAAAPASSRRSRNAERREVIEVTVEAAAGRVPVVAGTGALSTRETVELSVHAERAGATAVMVVPPFYEALELARAARPLHGGGGRDLDPDHVLQPARAPRA